MESLVRTLSQLSPSQIWYLLLGISNGAFLFGIYVDWRQRRAIGRPSRPKELTPLCSEEEYQKSRAYSHDCSSFGLVQTAIGHAVCQALLFGGVTLWVWRLAGQIMAERLGISPSSQILRSLLHVALMQLLEMPVGLIFAAYRTFWLERRHGFNKTTVKTFVLDNLKSLFLAVVLGGPILSALLWVMMRAGDRFVLWTGGLFLLLQLLGIVIYPTLIQPLFNKFTPLEEGELKDKISALASRVSFPLTKIYVVDGSTRSTHSNAYFFGLLKNKRIVLYDTLLAQMSTDEIVAIVGHELGHWAHNHMLQGLVVSQLNILWMFYLLSLAIGHGPLYEAFGFGRERPLMIGMSLFFQFLAPISLATSFLITWWSRHREFQADRYAVDLGYAEVLPTALVKLYKENKNLLHPDWLYSMMHYSHPPPSERLAAIRAYSSAKGKRQA